MKPSIALTFDDGPNGVATRSIVDILKSKNVPAAFFCIGSRIEKDPKTVRYVNDHGFSVANHSWRHSFYLPVQSLSAMRDELHRTSELLQTITGRPPSLFRPPHGFCTPRLVSAAQQERLEIIGWSVDPQDYYTDNAQLIVERIVKQAHDGGIILLHDGLHDGFRAKQLADRKGTIEALPLVIDALREKGYDFVVLDQLPRMSHWTSHLFPTEPKTK